MNLHELLEDAVADVEPTDRLADLRARTASPARAAARPWWWAAGATVVATAAAVATVAMVDQDPVESGHDHHHMATQPPSTTQLVAVYFPGPGNNLYREFDQVPAGDPLQAALDRLQETPEDPNYRTAWPAGSLESAALRDGTIDVELGGTMAMRMTDQLGAQQVVYTLQGAIGARLPVRFLRNGEETIGTVDADPTVLNPVSISDPAEGNSYEGSMTARGRAEPGSVHWEIQDPSGESIREGETTTTGSGGSLRPWEVMIDLDGLEPGTYTFIAARPDPSGGAELSVLDHDTRTIAVR